LYLFEATDFINYITASTSSVPKSLPLSIVSYTGKYGLLLPRWTVWLLGAADVYAGRTIKLRILAMV